MGLTTEELLFINKRVTDTRELVFLLHDKCMKVRVSAIKRIPRKIIERS